MTIEKPTFIEYEGNVLPPTSEPATTDEGPWTAGGEYQGFIPPELDLTDTQRKALEMADKAAKDKVKRDAELKAAYEEMWAKEASSYDNRDMWRSRDPDSTRAATMGRLATGRPTVKQQNANASAHVAATRKQFPKGR